MRNAWLARVVSIVGMGCAVVAGGAAFAADNDGLTLPAGFSAVVVHEGQGTARHLDVAANGDIYVAGRNGLSAMRDTNRDGKADVVTTFGDVKGTEVRVFKNWLYVSDDVGVYRYPLSEGPARARGRARNRGQRISEGAAAFGQDLRARCEGHSLYQRGRAFELLPGEGPAGRFAGLESVPHPREVRRRLGVRRHEAQPDSRERPALRHRHAQCGGHRMERRRRTRCSP